MGTLENRRKLTAVRGMGAALVGFAGWIVLYVVFGLIEPNIFTTNNMLNLLRSISGPFGWARVCLKLDWTQGATSIP